MAKKETSGGGIGELIKTLVYALLLAGFIRTILFQPFWIPSGSMKETLLIGDFLFVNKFAYGYSAYSCPGYGDFNLEGRVWGGEPERGDIIVFRHPTNGQDYIKRLIGLPGDTIMVQDGKLTINDTPVPQTDGGVFEELKAEQGPERNIPRCANEPIGLGGICEKTRTVETLPNGVSYPVLNIRDNGQGDNRGPFTVPEGEYFFMGDNRDNSVDSRFPQSANGVGYVPYANLIGRADRIIFSSAGSSILAFWTWRSDRFLRGVD